MKFEWRYFHNHLVIGTLISLFVSLMLNLTIDISMMYPPVWLSGGVFYGLREVIQYFQKGWWDGKGFWWPVSGSIILFYIAMYFEV